MYHRLLIITGVVLLFVPGCSTRMVGYQNIETTMLVKSTAIDSVEPYNQSTPTNNQILGTPAIRENETISIDPISQLPTGQIAIIQSGEFNNKILYIDISMGKTSQVNVVTQNENQLLYQQIDISPDGGKLIYTSGTENTDLSVFDLASRKISEVINPKCNLHDNPRWSPDGFSIAYTLCGDIYLHELSNNKIEQLTDTNAFEGSLAWSPDGNQLAYLGINSTKTGRDIFLFTLLDKSTRKIELDITASGFSKIDWSPDSEWIVYRSQVGCGDICVVHPDGTENYCLTNTPMGEMDPAWSTDGKFLVYVQSASDQYCKEEGGEPMFQGWKPRIISLADLELFDINNLEEGEYRSPVWVP